MFSENFKPSLNCNKVSKTANRIMGMIRRNITNKTVEGMMTLYKSLVRPTLEYCLPVWKPFMKKDLDQIEKVQKRFTKMIEGCKKLSYEDRLIKLGITSLEDRQHRNDMILVYKILNDKSNVYPLDILEKNDRIGRGNSLKLFKKRSKLEIRKHSFAFRVTDRWNGLPDGVVLSSDVNVFKGNLDRQTRDTRGHR